MFNCISENRIFFKFCQHFQFNICTKITQKQNINFVVKIDLAHDAPNHLCQSQNSICHSIQLVITVAPFENGNSKKKHQRLCKKLPKASYIHAEVFFTILGYFKCLYLIVVSTLLYLNKVSKTSIRIILKSSQNLPLALHFVCFFSLLRSVLK